MIQENTTSVKQEHIPCFEKGTIRKILKYTWRSKNVMPKEIHCMHNRMDTATKYWFIVAKEGVNEISWNRE